MEMTIRNFALKKDFNILETRSEILWRWNSFLKKEPISFGGRTCARADEACIYGAWLVHLSGTKPRGA